MTIYYNPGPQQHLRLVTPDTGEPIYLGPYNHQQAPFLECSHCGGPITVGQKLLPDMTTRILGVTQSGRLVYVTEPSQEGPAPVHEDCTAAYAHDHITMEPCEKDSEEESVCEVCESDIPEGHRFCAAHADNLSLRTRAS